MTTSSPKRVLLVDDNQDSVETLSLLIQAKGHEARIAGTGEDALAVADEYQPDVALLDLSLPGGMDGYEVARELRKRPYGARLVLVAVTGWGGREVRNKAAESGFDFHLLKPVEWSQLEKLLDAVQRAGVRKS
jgi:two-component system OmpR family response regulator